MHMRIIAAIVFCSATLSAQSLVVSEKLPLGLSEGNVWPAELDGDLRTLEAIQYYYVPALGAEFIRGVAFRGGAICKGTWIDPWGQVFASKEFQEGPFSYLYGQVFTTGIAKFVAQSELHVWVIDIGYGC